MWAVARYDFGLTDREFGEITIPQFWDLWKRRWVEFRRNCYLHGITASAVYNVHRSDENQHVFTPLDFSINRSPEEEQRTEFITVLKQSTLLARMEFPERIPQMKQDCIENLRAKGIKDPEGIANEVFDTE